MKKETIQKIEQEAEADLTYKMNKGDYRKSWRIFRIMAEFVEGYELLSGLKKEVTILGSARLKEDHKYYIAARNFGKVLAEHGYTTITGGGPGIMEAGNRGATEADGESVGLNIQLPFEQRVNPYVKKSAAFYYFFTRKVMLTAPAHAFVYFPGGFGTMDEFFEVVDHMELGKMCHVPVILYGSDYWNPILEFLKSDTCKEIGSMHEDEMEKWHVVDSPEEALAVIQNPDFDYSDCELSVMNFHSGSKNVDWRVFRIMGELVEGFEFLTGMADDVTIFGTKSIKPGNRYYEMAEELGQRLAQDGYATITGGAPGIAEAANRGAFEVGGESIGLGMEVHGKARMNKFVTRSMMFRFPFTRKLILTAPSKTFLFFPGGFGTMHQLFETLTLIQTKKMPKIPIILVGSDFWKPLQEVISAVFAKKFKTISPEDCDLYHIVDDIDTAMEIINNFCGK